MPGNAELRRRQIYYQGRVQGVGFRYTTRRIAVGFRVNGFVRNVPDGRVELVAEGEPAELDRFLAAVRRELGHFIDDVQETIGPARGESRFEIRYS